MVLSGEKAYSKIIDRASGKPARPRNGGNGSSRWQNNARREIAESHIYVRGGEFEQQLVFEGATFRMQRSMPLAYFMAISNTGPHDAPYGNGGCAMTIFMVPV